MWVFPRQYKYVAQYKFVLFYNRSTQEQGSKGQNPISVNNSPVQSDSIQQMLCKFSRRKHGKWVSVAWLSIGEYGLHSGEGSTPNRH